MIQRICLLFTAFLFTIMAFAQNSSKADEFGKKPGELIQKEFVTIGTIGNARMSVVNYTNLFDNETASSIQISNDYFVGAIDADEVDGFSKTIKQLQKTITTKPEKYTEVSFKTRSGFEAGTYYTEGKWVTYFMLEDSQMESLMEVTESDLLTLTSFISEAKGKMKK